MARAFISVESNIDPDRNVGAAVRRLAAGVKITAVSTVYRTARPGQPLIYHCVVAAETDLDPDDLRNGVLRRVESKLGRRRTEEKDAFHPIDLDLIVYSVATAESPDLHWFDPEVVNHDFLIAGLNELAPDLKFPGTGVSIAQVAAKTSGKDLTALAEYTEWLRKMVASVNG